MKNERIKHVEERPARGETRAERPQRVPIGGTGADVLAVKGIRPDYHPCWVNDYLVPKYLEAGYSFVTNDVTFGSYHVNQGNPLGARYARDVGAGRTAYLMECPLNQYEEDRKREEEDRQANEASIKTNAQRLGLDHGDLQLPNQLKL
jgi:hypothetical protein